ncbi:hypothetical protein Hypma_014478, partial [Hypsizygus marmoreus]
MLRSPGNLIVRLLPDFLGEESVPSIVSSLKQQLAQASSSSLCSSTTPTSFKLVRIDVHRNMTTPSSRESLVRRRNDALRAVLPRSATPSYQPFSDTPNSTPYPCLLYPCAKASHPHPSRPCFQWSAAAFSRCILVPGDCRTHTLVVKTLAGCANLSGTGSLTMIKCLTPQQLAGLIAHFSTSSSHDDKLVLAIIVTCFYGMIRLHEFNVAKASSDTAVLGIGEHQTTSLRDSASVNATD